MASIKQKNKQTGIQDWQFVSRFTSRNFKDEISILPPPLNASSTGLPPLLQSLLYFDQQAPSQQAMSIISEDTTGRSIKRQRQNSTSAGSERITLPSTPADIASGALPSDMILD